jgi:hypothetical protein
VHHWQAGLWGLCRPTETAQVPDCAIKGAIKKYVTYFTPPYPLANLLFFFYVLPVFCEIKNKFLTGW